MRLSRRAQLDLEEIENYVTDKAGLTVALRLIVSILDQLENLDGFLVNSGTPHPEIGPDIRSWPLGSYVAYYRAIRDEAEVARIRHGARNPETLALEE